MQHGFAWAKFGIGGITLRPKSSLWIRQWRILTSDAERPDRVLIKGEALLQGVGSHVLIEEVASGEVEDSTVILILGNQPIIQSREGLTSVGSPRLTTFTGYNAYNAQWGLWSLWSLWEDGAWRCKGFVWRYKRGVVSLVRVHGSVKEAHSRLGEGACCCTSGWGGEGRHREEFLFCMRFTGHQFSCKDRRCHHLYLGADIHPRTRKTRNN